MFTQNYYNMLANLLATSGSNYYSSNRSLPLITVNGELLRSAYDFRRYPSYVYNNLVTNATSSGISIGTGNTPPTLADINLESTITSGVSLSLADEKHGCDRAPYVEYTISVTNTGDTELVVREIGFKPGVSVGGGSDRAVLIERTVLETPLTIQAGDAGIIKYRLETTPVERTKSGVKLVPFTCGSDADIGAMIDAAHNGTIDLQTDGGWRVGDYRTIHIDAWTGGGDVAHPAQDIDIVITQFGDYNSCGCLLQFDFHDLITDTQRMNASATNVGGYGGSEMYLTTIPALIQALPSWLRTRLKTFDVLVGKGNVDEVETVANNKLALRSSAETDDQYGQNISAAGEGSAIQFYSYNSNNRKKRVSASDGYYWYRSPTKSGSANFVVYNSAGSSNRSSAANNTQNRLAVFGCL